MDAGFDNRRCTPPHIGEVAPNLFIGGIRALQEIDWLQAHEITHILKLYPDAPRWPDTFAVLDLPLDDGVFIAADVVRTGTAFIRKTLQDCKKVLVVCGAGQSRSATFILAYLLEQGYDLRDAFRRLRTARPQAWPARELWESLLTHYPTPYTLMEIQRWVTEKG